MTGRVDEYGVLLLRPEEEPVPEDSEHERLVDLLYAGLLAHFDGIEQVSVHCRLAWLPDREDTKIGLDPVVMVVFGRPQKRRRSYRA